MKHFGYKRFIKVFKPYFGAKNKLLSFFFKKETNRFDQMILYMQIL